MEIKAKFDHFNINVTNLERSIAFYEKALGLKEHHRKEASNGSFTLVYLTDNSIGFLLELTCLKDHPQAYELGENESHLCFRVAGDYEAIHQYHKEMGWVCFENTGPPTLIRSYGSPPYYLAPSIYNFTDSCPG